MATPPPSCTTNAEDPFLIEQTFGAFPGHAAPAARLEQLLAIHIQRKYFVGAVDTIKTAWWDYRIMSPGRSFMLFAHHRQEMLRAFTAGKGMNKKLKDKEGRSLAGVVGRQDAMIWDKGSREITSLWNAKMAADTFGIPYRDFIELSMQLALDDGWTRLPQPSQWYNEARLIRVIDAWNEKLSTGFNLAKHPMFHVINYNGSPLQIEYQDWLCEQVSGRKAPVRALVKVLFENPQVTIERATSFFGEEKVSEAQSYFHSYYS